MKTYKTLAVSAAALALAASLGFGAGQAQADQPRMRSALEALRAARHQLDYATPNKGGHRVEALRLVDQAIDEVKAGISAAE